jgi:hypothetical protein
MNDLMAVYLAGEASRPTRELVEQYAREHPDYANALSSAAELKIPEPPAAAAPDVEVAALNKTRQFVFLRSIFLGSALFFTLTPFLFHFGDGGFYWLLLGREPGLVWASASLGAASWVAYWLMSREVRKAGL